MLLPIAKVEFYEFVLFVHIASILIAFGGVFAYPIWLRAAKAKGPQNLVGTFAAMERIGKGVIGPASLLALATGIYMVFDRWEWGEHMWIEISLLILVYLVLVGPLYFSRVEAKLSRLAAEGAVGSEGSAASMSAEYEAAERQWFLVYRISILLILVALFLMTAKPF